MGQPNSTASGDLDAKETVKYQEFVKNYQFLRKIKDPRYGEISILQDKYTKELVALREILAKSAKDFERDMVSLRSRYKISHPNIIKVLGYTSKSEDNFCASIHKILMIVEYLDNDLEKEISLKKNQNNYYKEEQLWYLIENVIKALSALQKNEVSHEDLKPSSIFISKMGVYKIAQHNIAGNSMPAYHQRMTGLTDGRTYLSPALLTNLQNSELRPQHNPWKSDVFSLGMSILHAATLTNCEKLYNWNNSTLDLEELGERVASLRPKYSEKFQDFLQTMLDLRESSRPDFITLEAKLNTVSESEERGNPTPEKAPVKPRVHEEQQDVADVYEDIYSYRNRQRGVKAVPQEPQDTAGPYLQKNVANPIFKGESRIAPLRSEENPLPYSSVESVKRTGAPVPEVKAVDTRAPKFWDDLKKNEPMGHHLREVGSYDFYNRGNNQQDFMAPSMNQAAFGGRDDMHNVNVDQGYSYNRGEQAEFGVNKMEQPQSATASYQMNKSATRTQTNSLNNISSEQVQGQVGSKTFETNDNLRKSLISDEVARIMSDFRNKMGIHGAPAAEQATAYDYMKTQKENIRGYEDTGYYKDPYGESKLKGTSYPSENLPLPSQPVVNVVFHTNANYNTFAPEPVKMTPQTFQPSPYEASKDLAYGKYPVKAESQALADRSLNVSSKAGYQQTSGLDVKQNIVDLSHVQKPDIMQNPYEASRAYEQNQPYYNEAWEQQYSSQVASHMKSDQINDPALKPDPAMQSWDQSHISQAVSQIRNDQAYNQSWEQQYNSQTGLQLDNQGTNYYSQSEPYQDAQDRLKPAATVQTQNTYESIPQHSKRNEINSFEPFARNDYQAQLSQKVGYESQQKQQDNMYNVKDPNYYNQNYASNQSQGQTVDAHGEGRFEQQEGYYGYDSKQQDMTANAYSSVNSAQNRLSPLGANEPELVNETYPDGSVYEGYKVNGLRHGKGIFYYSDGGVYDGEWIEGSMEGYGLLYYAGGAKAYEGEWKEDKFHGRGAVFNEMPAQLLGEFDLTNFDSVGDFWVSYEGDFFNDNKEGNGVLLLANGERFEGQFKEDMVDGIGAFYTVDGRVIRGEWWQNKLIKPLV